MNRHTLWLSVLGTIACGCLTGTSSGWAQIVPDNTLPVNSTVVPGCIRCTIEGGTVRGVNLYHSFREFSVPTGGEAFFNNGAQIQTILTRVTGRNLSNIDGLIRANGSASLFLINPNGIIFGPNARLQVGGSFVASTASSFKFPDGSEFSATNPQAPPLLTINITPGLQRGTIASGSTIVNRGNLTAGQDLVLEGDRLDLEGQLVAGHDLTLQAQDTIKIRDSAAAPFIAVSGGNFLVQGNQSVDIFALNHPVSELVSGGTMLLRSANPVNGDAHYWSVGTFRIEQLNGELGTLVSLDDPVVRSRGDVTFRDYRGTSLHILAGGRVTVGAIVITGNGTSGTTINPTATPSLATVPLSNGGQVVINGNARPTVDIRAGMDPAEIGTPPGTSGYNSFLSGLLRSGFGSLDEDGFISTQAAPPNNNPTITGSDIEINVISIEQPNGQVLLTNQFRPNRSLPDGSITVRNTSIFGVGGIYTNSDVGKGGDIVLDARGDIRLNGNVRAFSQRLVGNTLRPVDNGGSVTLLARGGITFAPNTIVDSSGLLGGNITLRSGGNLSLQGGYIASESNTSGLGVGGDVSITVRSLILSDGASLGTSTDGGATGGNLTVNALEKVQLVGSGAEIGSALFALTKGSGKGGDVTIATPQLFLSDGGQVVVNTLGAGAGGNLTIRNANLIDIRGISSSGENASSLGTNAEGDGNAGTMTIETDQLRLLNGAQLGAGTFKAGNGGKVNITASDIRISGQDTGLYTKAVKGSTGNAGDVEIRTDRLLVEDYAELTANTESQGQGGAITITANQLMVQNRGEIAVRTLNRGTGGQITINAKNMVDVKGRAYISTASLPDATGSAGSLSITTNRLRLLEGGQIDSSSFGIGRGGDVFVTADSIEASGLSISGRISSSGLFVSANSQLANAGSGGNLKINTRQLLIRDGAQFNAGTYGGGAGGRLEINASEAIRIEGGNPDATSGIFSSTDSTGNAGDIQINTPLLALQGESTLDAGTAGAGRAGSIIISANALTLSDGARVATSTFDSGKAGDITLNISDRLSLTDPGTAILANTAKGSSGQGGNIIIDPELVEVKQGARIAVGSEGTGQGGNLFIRAGKLTLDRGSVTAETASAQGGNVTLDVKDLILLRRNSLISATAGTAQAGGDGGNINIQAGFVIGLLRENSDVRANAFTGRGGNINITTNGIIGLLPQPRLTPLSDITASSQFGLNGTITINSLNIDPSKGLEELGLAPVDPSKLVVQGCNSGRQVVEGQSRFVVLGRGGLSASPDDWFGGASVLTDLGSPVTRLTATGPTPTSSAASAPTEIVEAQGWVKGADGEIYLVNYSANPALNGVQLSPVQCQGL